MQVKTIKGGRDSHSGLMDELKCLKRLYNKSVWGLSADGYKLKVQLHWKLLSWSVAIWQEAYEAFILVVKVAFVVNVSESQARADSPDAGRPKTLPLEQSSTPQSRGGTATGVGGTPSNPAASVPSHLKTRRSLATESVSWIHRFFGVVFI